MARTRVWLVRPAPVPSVQKPFLQSDSPFARSVLPLQPSLSHWLVALFLAALIGVAAASPAFGQETASIGDLVWSDLDTDGEVDAGETGLQGVAVSLVGAGADGSFGTGDDLSFPNQNTNASGGYAFTGLQAGLYRVDVTWATAPAAFALTTGNDPLQVTLGPGQTYLTADFGFVYRGELAFSVDPGVVTTTAGNGSNQTVDGTGSGASFRDMGGVTSVDGWVYVATRGSIRKVNPSTGQVTTLAGHASSTGCTDSSNPSSVRFDWLSGLTSDGQYLYTLSSCTPDPKLRRIALDTGATTTLTTVPGAAISSFPGSSEVVFGPDGYLYATAGSNTTVVRVDASSGAKTTFATLAGSAYGISADRTHLWVLIDVSGTRRIERVALSDASVTTFVSSTDLGTETVESAGSHLYVATSSHFSVRRYKKADASWTLVAGTNATGYADGTATDAWFAGVKALGVEGGVLWVADDSNKRLRKAVDGDPLPASQPASATTTLNVDPGAVTTFAGSGASGNADGVGTQASFENMAGVVAVDGHAYVATRNYIRKVNLATGQVTRLAGNGGNGCGDSITATASSFYYPTGVATDGRYIYSASGCPSGQPSKVRRTALATGATSTVATVTNVQGITFGPDGYLYATTGTNRTVVRVDRNTGATSTFATVGGDAYSITSDATHLWVSIDTGSTRRIEKIAISDATVTPFVSGTELSRWGLESAGNYLYASADHSFYGYSIRRYTKADGNWAPVAGTNAGGYADGTATDAWLNAVQGIASDGAALWISDSYNNRLRKAVDADPLPASQPSSATTTLNVDPGAVTTLAGSGAIGDADGVGTQASFENMTGVVAVDGHAYVATKKHVRKVNLTTGQVTKLAGNGSYTCGDSGSGTGSSFYAPRGAATDGRYIYTTSGCPYTQPSKVRRTSLATGATSTVATVTNPQGVTFGPDGYLYVATGTTRTVVRVDRNTGAISTFATLSGDAYAITSDAAHLWVAV
jgi:glucose/arabinose dehydrogenase